MTLTDRLIAEGYDVETAIDGETGLARGSAESFDLIILDGMLPGRDGFDVCRTIRQRGVQTPDPHAHRPRPGRRPRGWAEAGRR